MDDRDTVEGVCGEAQTQRQSNPVSPFHLPPQHGQYPVQGDATITAEIELHEKFGNAKHMATATVCAIHYKQQTTGIVRPDLRMEPDIQRGRNTQCRRRVPG
jgi:hypothetical protein